eukprot:15436358-Alexandrium_andersonii.AAC.1
MELAEVSIGGEQVPIVSQAKLVGTTVSTELEAQAAADERLRAAHRPLQRIARIRAPMLDRARVVEGLAAARIVAGIEVHGPSAAASA